VKEIAKFALSSAFSNVISLFLNYYFKFKKIFRGAK
jgi:hypothetical protein